MNLSDPWVLLRVLCGLFSLLLFARAFYTAVRVLRRFDVGRAHEGQLLLEKQLSLSAALVRVGLVAQAAAFLLTVYVTDRLHHSLRGAMCGYGVFASNAWGFRALSASLLSAIASGLVAQLFAFDAMLRKPLLARALALCTLALLPLAAIDLLLTVFFLLKIDLSVVVTCCSFEIENHVAGAANAAGFASFGGAARALIRVASPVAVLLALASSAWCGWWPHQVRRFATWAAVASLFALLLGLAFSVFESAPHAFEVPQHTCPFCLLRADVFGLGYALFPALFFGFVWGISGYFTRICLRGAEDGGAAWATFASARLRKSAIAWACVLLLAGAPLLRYAWLTGHLLHPL
jgi:hypothetical protein